MSHPNLYKFKIEEKLEERLCYTLYRASDQTTEQTVFLKLLNEEHSRDEANAYHFLNNARILQSLTDPGLCKVYQYGTDLDYYYVATEPIELEPISSLIQDEFSLSSEDLLEIFTRIGTTLRHAHLAGLVHGLLNPKNIYISHDGSIKIDDFGLCWYGAQTLKIDNEESLFLAQYLAPELRENGIDPDGRADIYSLGVIMTHLIAGQPPFSGASLSVIQEQQLQARLPELKLTLKDLPEELENVLARALNVSPNRRFHNMKEFIGSLQTLRKEALQYSYSGAPEPEDELETLNFNPYQGGDVFVSETPPEENRGAWKFGRQSGGRSAFLGGFLGSKNAKVVGVAILGILLIIVAAFNVPFTTNSSMTSDSEAQIESNWEPPGLYLPQQQEQPPPANGDHATQNVGADAGAVANRREQSTEDTKPHWGPDLYSEPSTDHGDRDDEPSATVEEDITPTASRPVSQPPAQKPEAETAAAVVTAPENETKPAATPPKQPSESTPPPLKAQDEPVVSGQLAEVTFETESQDEPIEAFVFIDDRFKGKTDANGELTVKDLKANTAYTVRVSREGFTTVTKRFTASEKPTVLTFDISPKEDIFATLVLDVQPNADSILVDGQQYRGQSPLKLTLPWGEHRVRFVNNRLNKSWEQVVDLKVGQTVRVKHDFAQSEVGKVAISLKNASEFGFAFVYVDGKPWQGRPNTTPVEIQLPVGSHTLEVRKDGFSAIPRDIIVVIDKGQTKHVSFTLTKNP